MIFFQKNCLGEKRIWNTRNTLNLHVTRGFLLLLNRMTQRWLPMWLFIGTPSWTDLRACGPSIARDGDNNFRESLNKSVYHTVVG